MCHCQLLLNLKTCYADLETSFILPQVAKDWIFSCGRTSHSKKWLFECWCAQAIHLFKSCFARVWLSTCLFWLWMCMNADISTNCTLWMVGFFLETAGSLCWCDKTDIPVAHLCDISLKWENKPHPGEHAVNQRIQETTQSYPDELCECVVDVGTAWHEETTAGAQIVEEEQLLILWSQQRQ